MVRSARILGAIAFSAILALSPGAAGAARADGDGSLTVHAVVFGYTPPNFSGTEVSVQLNCGPSGNFWLTATTSPVTGDSIPKAIPNGTLCAEMGAAVGDPGNGGTFMYPQVSPSVQFQIDGPTTVSVTVERVPDGSPPEWDLVTGYQLDVLTADKATVNRNGGLTLEGLVSCASIAGTPVDPYVDIAWDATQYVGRKTAITGSYHPAIAYRCDVATPIRWQTLGPGTQDKVMWIYGSNGKFAAGMVHVEVQVLSHQEIVVQWWDTGAPDYSPACSTTKVDNGFYDRNGDGYCAYYVDLWSAEQFDLRVVRAR